MLSYNFKSKERCLLDSPEHPAHSYTYSVLARATNPSKK